MNKRVAKKRGAGRNFWMTVQAEEGAAIPVHVNCRGAKRPPDAEFLAAIEELTRAVHAMGKAQTLPSSAEREP